MKSTLAKYSCVIVMCLTAGACSKGPAAGGTADTPHPAGAAVTPSTQELPDSARPFSLKPEQLSRIQIGTAAISGFRGEVATTGTVAFNGDKSTQVLAPVSGPTVKVLVDQGSVVKVGEPLATVTSPDFAAAVASYRKADDAYKNLKRIADQDEQMFKADAIARRDLEQAQTDASGAGADREAAIDQMRALGMDDASITAVLTNRGGAAMQAVIRSPIEGTIVEKLISPGQLLQAGSTPCFTITDLSQVWVMANVFEADLGLVTQGEPVTVTTRAWPHPLPGKVAYVAALVDPNTRATAVRVLVDNPGQVLKRDMLVDVNIASSMSRSGILVPAAAVLRDDDNLPFVFVQQADKSFLRRRVVLGQRVNDTYEITSGLKAGDRFVANGALFIQFAETQ